MSEESHIVFGKGDSRSEGFQNAPAGKVIGIETEDGKVGIFAGKRLAETGGVIESACTLLGDPVQCRCMGGLQGSFIPEGSVGTVSQTVKDYKQTFLHRGLLSHLSLVPEAVNESTYSLWVLTIANYSINEFAL
jgi:hypothetical protein